MTPRLLILGIGNILLSDEGFGVHAVRYLQDNYQWGANVQLVDGGTRGLMLMAELMECDVAVILDVAQAGEQKGSFYILEDADMDRSLSFCQSMHQTSLSDILVSCDLAGARPETLVFAMEPFDISSPRVTLTQEARALLPQFCAMVVAELRRRRLLE